jgi:hypothetical protein
MVAMLKKLFYDKGGYIQVPAENDKSRLVSFPVCLAIKHGDSVSAECPDFILNTDESWVFVRSETPLPGGTQVIIHFYVPPEIKLLAEIQGTVSTMSRGNVAYQKGMLIKFSPVSRETIKLLEGYIEGKKHLIDRKA